LWNFECRTRICFWLKIVENRGDSTVNGIDSNISRNHFQTFPPKFGKKLDLKSPSVINCQFTNSIKNHPDSFQSILANECIKVSQHISFTLHIKFDDVKKLLQSFHVFYENWIEFEFYMFFLGCQCHLHAAFFVFCFNEGLFMYKWGVIGFLVKRFIGSQMLRFFRWK
jgi:hypothetical protein